MSTTVRNEFKLDHNEVRGVGKKVCFLKWLVMILILVALPAWAAVYYVDSAAGSDSNSGTSTGSAWAHIPGAVGFSGSGWVQLRDKDIVYVKGGSVHNYQLLFDSSRYAGASAYNSIQVMSGDGVGFGAGRFILDQQNTRAYGVAFGPGSTGIRLSGAEIRNIAASTSAIYGNGSACIEMGNPSALVQYVRVDDCYLHDAVRTVDDTGHGIEWYGPDSTAASKVIIENNQIGPRIGTKGIEFYGTGNIIRNNFISNSGDHGICNSGYSSDIYNNIIYMVPPYAHEPVFGIKINYNNNDVWNNIIYQNVQTTAGSDTTDLEGLGTLNNASNNRFFNNTVVNCSDLNHNRTGAGFSFADEGGAGSGNIVQNCIFAFNTNNVSSSWYNVQVYMNLASSQCKLSYCNLWSAKSTDSVIAINSGGSYSFYTAASANSAGTIGSGNTFANLTQVNPGFVGGSLPTGLSAAFAPNTTYFQLSASSPLAVTSTGNNLTTLPANGAQPSSKFATDILGVKRTAWSMGAYEYGTAATPPPAPTGLHVVAGL